MITNFQKRKEMNPNSSLDDQKKRAERKRQLETKKDE